MGTWGKNSLNLIKKSSSVLWRSLHRALFAMDLYPKIEWKGGWEMSSQDSIEAVFSRLIKKTERWCLVFVNGKPKVMEMRESFDPGKGCRLRGQTFYFSGGAFTEHEPQLLIGHPGGRHIAQAGAYLRLTGYPGGIGTVH